MGNGYYNFIKSTFNTVAFDYVGVTVKRYPVTVTYNAITGDEDRVYSSSQNITVNIDIKSHDWFYDKIGKIEGGDALMLVSSEQEINKDDKIEYNNNTYLVKNIMNVIEEDTIVFKSCNLFLYGDD